MDALTVIEPQAINRPAAENPARVYIASLESAASKRAMTRALVAIVEVAAPAADLDAFPWAMLRYQHTQAIRARLAERFDAATVNLSLSALRQTLKNAWQLGQMTAEEYMTAADVRNVKGEKPDAAAGRALNLGEIMALVAACQDGTPTGARDAAILAVSYSCGLRRAEVVSLDLAHYDRVASVFTVHGKRNKTRTVPIQNGARSAVEDWLTMRGEWEGPLFVGIRKGQHMTRRRMTAQAIYHIFTERAARAGVSEFSPHDLRRTFAGDLLDAGADIVTVQKMMGHANVTTTARYDRRGERAKQDAARKLHFPYQRKLAK